MRDQFRGYYTPTDAEFDALWSTGLIVLDTNVLLNLYQYPLSVTERLFGVLDAVSNRLWVPHQVALEFHLRREAVIRGQLQIFDKVRDVLSFARLKGELDKLQLRKRHSLISVDEILTTLQPVLENFSVVLDELEGRHIKPAAVDPIRERINALIGDSVGGSFTNEELTTIYAEGEERYKRNMPPGYEDQNKAKQPSFTYGGITYQPRFGDLVLWKQIIRHVAATETKHVMLISDDEKPDWRQVLEHKGERVVLPRPELVDEIRREAKVEVFYMYSSEVFLRYAGDRLGVDVGEQTIQQVADVKAAAAPSADVMSLIQVIGQEGNRRDARLYCGHCQAADVSMHFYEGDGTPKLSEVLGPFHYWECPKVQRGASLVFLMLGLDNDATEFTWNFV